MIVTITAERMLVFFVSAVGFAAARFNIIKDEHMFSLSQIITKVLLPAMIFYSTYVNCTRQSIIENWKMVFLAALFYAAISLLMFLTAKAMRIEHDKDRVFQLCFIFGNTGFVGIPLLATVFPDVGLVYMMMFTIVDQLVFWTYGVWLSTERNHYHPASQHLSIRSLVTPNTVAIVVAIVFVMVEIPIPELLLSGIGTIDSATTGMCMIYLGALTGLSYLLPVLKRPEAYVGIILKMIVLPVIAGKLLLISGFFPEDMVLALAIIMALPVMTVVPMLVAANGVEREYATGMTVMTLIASIVTIPLVVLLISL